MLTPTSTDPNKSEELARRKKDPSSFGKDVKIVHPKGWNGKHNLIGTPVAEAPPEAEAQGQSAEEIEEVRATEAQAVIEAANDVYDAALVEVETKEAAAKEAPKDKVLEAEAQTAREALANALEAQANTLEEFEANKEKGWFGKLFG